MNHEREFPEDFSRGADAGELPEGLAEIERRLKKARPARPRLDVAALQRLVCEAAPPVPGVARRSWWIGPCWPGRRTAAVAASWACGAAVGAAVTFLWMSRTLPDRPPPDAGVRITQETPVPVRGDNGPSPSDDRAAARPKSPGEVVPTQTAFDAAWVAMMLGLFGSDDLARPQDGPTLRAGMHLRDALAAPPRLGDETAMAPRTDGQQPDAAPQRQPRFEPDVAPPATRARLLRELLEAPGAFL
mgnify:CR=1 FL=1